MEARPPISAKRYFRRSGILMIVAGVVIAAVAVLVSPDWIGRIFGGALAAMMLFAGAMRLRRVGQVSETAVVRETVAGRRVGYVVEDPGK